MHRGRSFRHEDREHSISLENTNSASSDISPEEIKNEGKAYIRKTNVDADDYGLPGEGVKAKYMGSAADRREMSTLGRKQVLRRNFNLIPVIGFGAALVGTWEFILGLLTFALTDGGPAGLIWGLVVIVAGFTLVYLSLSEMASMSPTSGGQYHWVSEFAPRSAQKYLSYMTGYLVATGWQGSVAGTAFLAGTIIQGLIVLNDASYVFERWQGTLLVIAINVFSVMFNTFLAKKLPMVESLILVIHVLGAFAIVIPLWVLAPRNSASAVFTQFSNAGGWGSAGTATMIGLSTNIGAMAGFDSVVHMSEEIKDASETLPKALMAGVAVNGVLGLLVAITVCFTIGDVNTVLSTPTGYPFIQIFYNTTGSYAATNVMVLILIVTFTASVISEIATSSRQLWSFARDGGLPFSSVIARVKPGWNIPLNAVLASLGITVALSLINIGSAVALNALTSITISSLISSYIVTISCLLLKRLRGEPLPPRRWSLGRYGTAINIGSLLFLAPLFVFAFFPLAIPVVPSTMNWGIVMFAGITGLATLYYLLWGRFQYVPPVVLVKRDRMEY